MFVITKTPIKTKFYFKGYELGFPNFSDKIEEAKKYKTKKEALNENIINTKIERFEQ